MSGSMPQYAWMYGDRPQLAFLNPLRWSGHMPYEEILDELEKLSATNKARPIYIERRNDLCGMQKFPTVNTAMEELGKRRKVELSDLDGEAEPASTEDELDSLLDKIGKPKEAPGDNLKQIRGIGPYNETALKSIQINSFRQIAKMTPEVLKDAKKAIVHFGGRIEGEHWVFQAQKIEDGKWKELVPDVEASGRQHHIEIGGKKYERELIDIANHYPDGKIEASGAEALWWSALDGRGVTDVEKDTIEYILNSDKYKLNNAAKEYLTTKLKEHNEGKHIMP